MAISTHAQLPSSLGFPEIPRKSRGPGTNKNWKTIGTLTKKIKRYFHEMSLIQSAQISSLMFCRTSLSTNKLYKVHWFLVIIIHLHSITVPSNSQPLNFNITLHFKSQSSLQNIQHHFRRHASFHHKNLHHYHIIHLSPSKTSVHQHKFTITKTVDCTRLHTYTWNHCLDTVHQFTIHQFFTSSDHQFI